MNWLLQPLAKENQYFDKVPISVSSLRLYPDSRYEIFHSYSLSRFALSVVTTENNDMPFCFPTARPSREVGILVKKSKIGCSGELTASLAASENALHPRGCYFKIFKRRKVEKGCGTCCIVFMSCTLFGHSDAGQGQFCTCSGSSKLRILSVPNVQARQQ